jgi:hypothetical protein
MKATYAAHVAIVSPKSAADLNQRGGALLKMRFWATLRNNGQSETQNMRSTVAAKTLPMGAEFIYDFPGEVDDPPHGMVIGPEVELNTGEVEIDAQLIYAIITGGGRLFVYGWAEYDDIFPDTMRHRLEYCFQIRVQPTGGWMTNFDTYGPHNRHYDVPRPAATPA